MKLVLWIVQHLQIRTGVTVRRIRFDGELFANNELKTELAKLHIMAEPTGAYNLSQNGKAEVSITLVGLVAQCLLYGAQLPSSMWCFAVLYATFLLNVRPSNAQNGKTPHELFHKQVPNLSKAFIFGSPLHVKICRSTCHRPDPNTLLGTFVGFQGTPTSTSISVTRVVFNTQLMQSLIFLLRGPLRHASFLEMNPSCLLYLNMPLPCNKNELGWNLVLPLDFLRIKVSLNLVICFLMRTQVSFLNIMGTLSDVRLLGLSRLGHLPEVCQILLQIVFYDILFLPLMGLTSALFRIFKTPSMVMFGVRMDAFT